MTQKLEIYLLLLSLLGATFILSCDDGSEKSTEENGTDVQDTETALEVDTTANTAIEDLTTLEGKTYLVAFNPGYWSTPRDVGEEVGAYVPGFLFQITSVDTAAGTFEAILSTATEDGAQDMCAKTAAVTGTITDNISFMFDPLIFEAMLSGPEKTTIAPIHAFAIGGSFTEQGAGFNKGVIDAVMDFRDVACIFTLLAEENRTAEGICERMLDMGYACETCPFEPTVIQCITMKAQLFKASAVDVTLVPVAEFDTTCIEDQSCLP